MSRSIKHKNIKSRNRECSNITLYSRLFQDGTAPKLSSKELYVSHLSFPHKRDRQEQRDLKSKRKGWGFSQVAAAFVSLDHYCFKKENSLEKMKGGSKEKMMVEISLKRNATLILEKRLFKIWGTYYSNASWLISLLLRVHFLENVSGWEMVPLD